MDITGTVIQILAEQSGSSRSGNTWRKQEYIIETPGNYPKKVCIAVWGDKIEQFGIQQGETITAGIEIESREYNNRWYTDIKAWRVDREGQSASAGAAAGSGNNFSQKSAGSPDVSSFSDDSAEDVLPF
ncbi:hypothetical protein A3SI_05994 [Nitritalea halalkaliphila LW7]|uniref:DUF3127 domain-containing protein n=1 Tax=Nitritalea halalkaliphila LW7 TaxID=1189621 RepID=I5C7A5_9BACT|nr:DUF3127 domain-containing protein [Nitritalea halalkaliphila]EIM77707.1 hypothetical protein A3SI_05994 [Nitritalea halalkaliphila LW7]